MDTLTRTSDPDTSHLAGERASKTRLTDVCRAIVGAYERVSVTEHFFRGGMTDEEIYNALTEDERTRWSDRAVRHGRTELVKQGRLVLTDTRRKNKRGSWCRVYRLVG